MSSAKQIAAPLVLLVEDEALIRFSTADDLRDAGFAVLEASNADDAIRMLERHNDVKILFTDIDMPGSMDGLKLSVAVRDRWPPVRIIVTSGHIKVDEKNLPSGSRFFAKPYDSGSLVRLMREYAGI